MKKVTDTLSFIERSIDSHGDLYDYSRVEYTNSRTNVEIICNKHGSFFQNPRKHYTGQGCPICSGNSKINTDDFNQLLFSKFGDTLDYSKTVYQGMNSKATIFCLEHGSLERTAKSILSSEIACTHCSNTSKIDSSSFLEKASIKHNHSYDYSLIKKENIKNNQSLVLIRCKTHGVFRQRVKNHLEGHGCPTCRSSKGERIISSALSELSVEFETQYPLTKNPKTNRFLKVDFFLPHNNTVIEFDGIQHYEPIDFFGGKNNFKNISNRDNIKNNYCVSNDINLIRIKYDTDPNEIKSIIESIV